MSTSSLVAALDEEDTALEESYSLATALQRAEQGLQTARERGEPQAIARALALLGRMRFRLGQYEAAAALAREALTLAAPNAPARVDAWQVLGNCAAESHSLAEAELCYRTAAELAREVGYPRAQVAALHGLGAGVYFPRGQCDLALASVQEACAIARRAGHQEWLVYPLTALAMIYGATGQRYQARLALDELAPLATPSSMVQGYHLCLSASLILDEGDLQAARALYAQARTIAEASGEPWLNIAVRLGMARYHRLAEDGPAARAWADDALAFALRVGYRQEQGKALLERGRANWLCDDRAAAEADFRAAIETLNDLGAALDAARARFLLAALLHEEKRPAAGAAWLDVARSVVQGGYAFLLEQERALAFPLLSAYQNHADAALARACAALLERLWRITPPPLRVITLGRWEVWQGARRIPRRALRQRRAGELLALLLLAPGHRLTFEQVAEALFPEKDLPAAQMLFHHATSALRRALEPDLPPKFPCRYVQVEEGQVMLHLPPGSWLDCEAFEAHCQRKEWVEALALYAGELLPDYVYANWTLTARERLSLLYQRALLAAAEAWLAEGRAEKALDACQRILTLEPWHENAVLVGMRACIALNDVAGARRLYLKLEEALRQDLGVAPHQDLQHLYRSLTPPQS